MSDFYGLATLDGQMRNFDFASLKGKVVLIVNVASLCGFSPQYDDLEKLYKKYGDQGLEIIAFPCNQFGGQEPESTQNLETFIREQFKCTFPVMKKTIVNGDDTNPVYAYLKLKMAGSLGFRGIRWNFEKFLIDRDGVVRHRFVSAVSPLQIEPVIVSLLKNS